MTNEAGPPAARVDPAPAAADRRTVGPTRPASEAPSTTAPAPSPNSEAVRLSSGFTRRLVKSAPITSADEARPASTRPDPTFSADRNPLQAASTSKAPACTAPINPATSGAAAGIVSSAVEVATMTRSSSEAPTPARSRASIPARAARSDSRSPSPARRRSVTPVRDSIHCAVTPRRSAIDSLETTASGSAAPTPSTAAPRSAGGAGAATGARSRSDMGGLRERHGLDVRQRLSDEPGEHLARPDLHEPRGSGGLQREQHVGPAHRRRERVDEP